MQQNIDPMPSIPQDEYTAQQITVLEGLSAVRVRPSMYIGNVATEGLHHLPNPCPALTHKTRFRPIWIEIEREKRYNCLFLREVSSA